MSLVEVLTSEAMEIKEVSSANNLFLRPFYKSLTYIKNKRSPRIEPCGTQTRISTQDKTQAI